MSEEKKNKGGRPPLFKEVSELQERIDAFWLDYESKVQSAKENKEPKPPAPSKAEFMLALGFSNAETYNQYKKKPGFSDTIKESELRLEALWNERLQSSAAAGTIFYLKNAFGYRDKTETDLTSGGKPINFIFDPSFKEDEEE